MATYTIDVTQEDIDAGVATNCHLCPIALAGQRVFPTHRVSVTSGYFLVYNAVVLEVEKRLPAAARIFIADFDSGREVQPFSFDMGVVND